MMSAAICKDPARRELVRRAEMNGIDFVEVADDPKKLFVYFLGRPPEELTPANVRIEGGRRIRNLVVERIVVERASLENSDDRLRIELKCSGDASSYRLCLVEPDLDEQGAPVLDATGARSYRPLSGFDPRYHCVCFSFEVASAGELDCKLTAPCPPPVRSQPAINYLAKDYASFRQLILDRLSLTLPDWQERHAPDLGVVLAELLAYVADHLSYFQDAVATEAYLDTARQRISVRRHARLVDYALHEGNNARAWVSVETDAVLTLPAAQVAFLTGSGEPPGNALLAEDEVATRFAGVSYETFEPLLADELRFYPGHNSIRFYTWGDRECCLPRGATSATLADFSDGEAPAQRVLQLDPSGGDVLIFEEVLGPGTGDPADADRSRRHALRLTRAEPGVDPVTKLPVVEIEWALEDALPFPFCLSTIGPAPDCRYLENVSVARGNIVAVDHGFTLPRVPLGQAPVSPEPPSCECAGLTALIGQRPLAFRPTLAKAPLTFREPPQRTIPATSMLHQDPRKAVPQVAVTSRSFRLVSAAREQPSPAAASTTSTVIWGRSLAWRAQPDLISSGPLDTDFVVEVDDARLAHLRFGDGRNGRSPASTLGFEPAEGSEELGDLQGDSGSFFWAIPRIGNGRVGNVGAEAICYLLTRGMRVTGVTLRVRNPLAAAGGSEPEPIEEAKLYAPRSVHTRLERAVTAQDYAAIVERDFSTDVQRAAAALRWTGSWYEALISVDARGKTGAPPALLGDVAGGLHRYRRILHDVATVTAKNVPLDIALQVCVDAHHTRGQIKRALLERFSNRVQSSGELGFFHPDRLSFGDDVFLSRIVALARAIEGVQDVSVVRFKRWGELANGELEEGVLRLGPSEVARLDNDPEYPENGTLSLEVRGPR